MTRVYVLGAGASVESGAPTVLRFQEQARKLIDVEPGHAPHGFLDGIQREAIDAFAYWKRFEGWDLERFYAHCDLKHRLDPTNRVVPRPPVVAQIIAATLAASFEDNLDLPGRQAYQSFVQAMLAGNDRDVISFNWDITVETAARDELNLGAPVAMAQGAGWRDVEPASAGIKLHKVHGSTDWRYCNACDRIQRPEFLGKIAQDPSFQRSESCMDPDCWTDGEHSTTLGALIPPFLDKTRPPGLQRLFSRIWRNATNTLHRAEELVLIGYSIPDSDPHFVMLLEEWFEQGGRDVTVVNHGSSAENVKRRVEGLCQPFGEANVTVFDEGFAAWCRVKVPGWPRALS